MLDSERIAPSQKVLLDSVGHRKFYWTALLHMGKKKKNHHLLSKMENTSGVSVFCVRTPSV